MRGLRLACLGFIHICEWCLRVLLLHLRRTQGALLLRQSSVRNRSFLLSVGMRRFLHEQLLLLVMLMLLSLLVLLLLIRARCLVSIVQRAQLGVRRAVICVFLLHIFAPRCCKDEAFLTHAEGLITRVELLLPLCTRARVNVLTSIGVDHHLGQALLLKWLVVYDQSLVALLRLFDHLLVFLQLLQLLGIGDLNHTSIEHHCMFLLAIRIELLLAKRLRGGRDSGDGSGRWNTRRRLRARLDQAFRLQSSHQLLLLLLLLRFIVWADLWNLFVDRLLDRLKVDKRLVLPLLSWDRGAFAFL